MSDESFNTTQIQDCVQRWQGGSREAADQIVNAIGKRMEHLTNKMLRGFPAVRHWAETVDVVQGGLIRLLNTLQRLQPESKRHFYNLAAVHVRRELLDLTRRFSGQRFARLTPLRVQDGSHADGSPEPAAPPTEGGDLDLWCRFHEAVEKLPAEEREVVGLIFYHGWKHAQIAELFQVDERTIRRRWQSACQQLHELVRSETPQP